MARDEKSASPDVHEEGTAKRPQKRHAEDAPEGALRQALLRWKPVAREGAVWPFLFMVLLVRPSLKLFPLTERTKSVPFADGITVSDLTLGIKRFLPCRAFGMKTVPHSKLPDYSAVILIATPMPTPKGAGN